MLHRDDNWTILQKGNTQDMAGFEVKLKRWVEVVSKGEEEMCHIGQTKEF